MIRYCVQTYCPFQSWMLKSILNLSRCLYAPHYRALHEGGCQCEDHLEYKLIKTHHTICTFLELPEQWKMVQFRAAPSKSSRSKLWALFLRNIKCVVWARDPLMKLMSRWPPQQGSAVATQCRMLVFILPCLKFNMSREHTSVMSSSSSMPCTWRISVRHGSHYFKPLLEVVMRKFQEDL